MKLTLKGICKFFLGCCIILHTCSCKQKSPNSIQVTHTLENINCYNKLISQIKDNETHKAIKTIRNEQISKSFEPVWLIQKERIISIDEINEYVDPNWIANCYDKLNLKNDLRGIRMLNDSCTIIEIDYFHRRTLTGKFSKNKTLEFHRLISRKCKNENFSFYFGNEMVIFKDTINKEYIYQVSQMEDPR